VVPPQYVLSFTALATQIGAEQLKHDLGSFSTSKPGHVRTISAATCKDGPYDDPWEWDASSSSCDLVVAWLSSALLLIAARRWHARTSLSASRRAFFRTSPPSPPQSASGEAAFPSLAIAFLLRLGQAGVRHFRARAIRECMV